MMKWVVYLALLLAGMASANVVLKNTKQQIEEVFELVVFTVSICDHCAVFEADVIDDYKNHKLAKTAPLVKVNMDDHGTGPYHLQQPITNVPTTIVMKNGKEVARMHGVMDKLYFYIFVRDSVFPVTRAEHHPAS